MVRSGEFRQLAKLRVVYVVAALIPQLAIPLCLLPGAIGLISGQIVGFSVAAIFATRALNRTGSAIPKSCVRRLARAAYKYRKYPKYDVGAALMSNLNIFGPAVLLAALFDTTVAGWYAFAHRLLAMPLTLLSNSLSRVYYSEAARIGANDHAALRQIFRHTLSRLLLIAVPPVMLAAAIAPWMFAVIFGAQWREAGWYCTLLTPMLLAHVVASVLGPTLDVVGRQGLRLIRESVCLLLIVSGIVVPKLLAWPAVAAVAAMSALGTVGYVFAIGLIWSAIVSRHDAQTVLSLRRVPSRAA
jgi:O-antigen/teichoic acid export membrane protein